jgi:hypothetical protein
VGHGSAAGRCAFKTITYALTQTDGTVSLSPAIYSEETGEKLPLILKARHHLACNGAHIEGPGKEFPSPNLTIAVEFDGDENGLSDCVIRGGNLDGYCVQSWGARQVLIERSDISNCGGAAVTIDTGSASLVGNTIHDSLLGIDWYGYGRASSLLTGSMVGNRFSGNRKSDIDCFGRDLMVTGYDNVRGNGPAVCTGCANCPF